MRSLLICFVGGVIAGILIFLCLRDSRMLVFRSPDRQIQITLWDRADLFGDDLRVTVNRAGHEQFLYKHLNDNCGSPRQGHVVWTHSQLAAIFLDYVDLHFWHATGEARHLIQAGLTGQIR
jgi:hypothetical protein